MRAIEVARRHAVTGMVFCVLGFLVVWVLAYHVPPLERLDDFVLAAINSPPGTFSNEIAYVVELFADPVSQVLAVVAACCLAVIAGRPRGAFFAVALVAGTAIIVQILKFALEHHRYDAAAGDAFYWYPLSNAFPSGHSAGSLSIALAFLYVVPPSWKRPAAIAGAIYTLAVSSGLVVLNYHYPSDVLGGWLVAAGWCFALLAASASRRTFAKPGSRSLRRSKTGLTSPRRAEM